MATDTRTKHYTATLDIQEVTGSGLVSPTDYPRDGKTVDRAVSQVSKVVVRADSLEDLQVKLQQLLGVGTLF